MINSPRTNSVIDFNVYNLFMHEFTIDPSDNEIFNAPCVLDSIFSFKNTLAEDANKSIQTLIIAKKNIIYTREYDFITKTYTQWYSITDAVQVVITELKTQLEQQQECINKIVLVLAKYKTSLNGIDEVLETLLV